MAPGASALLEPRILHALPGRLRVHLPQWDREGNALEAAVARTPGVRRAHASATTGNLLIEYDAAAVDEAGILALARSLQRGGAATRPGGRPDDVSPAVRASPADLPHAVTHQEGETTRARIAVRGVDRNPALAHTVVTALRSRFPGTRVTASALTGRVLVEFRAADISLQDLIATVADLEMPEFPGEDRPGHPLDPAPLFQTSARLIGASLGLAVVATRQARGGPAGFLPAARVAGILSIVQSLPPVRNALSKALGPDRAALAMTVPTIVAMTFSGSALGLLLAAAESLRLLTEIRARRDAWSRYEAQLEDGATGAVGSHVRMEGGDVARENGVVVEGSGFAEGEDGEPHPVAPGSRVTAGAVLTGGPFVVELLGGSPFSPSQRPCPVTPSLHDQYLRYAPPVALAYAAVTALVTGSAGRTLVAMLLVNQRAAVVGAECADTAAATRVLRAGVTVVGTRRERAIRLPHTLLLDCPRTLADGYEVVETVSLVGSRDAAGLLATASAVAVAAGQPWGKPWVLGKIAIATEGTFDGTVARATVGGVNYSVREVKSDDEALPDDLISRTEGDYLLVLCGGRGERRLGVLILRPRLAAGTQELVATCRRHGVHLALVGDDDPAVSAAIARRTGIALIPRRDPAAVVREYQARGQRVAFVSDGAHAAAGFDACDLGIGLTDFRHRFSARADLLAADFASVAAILDAGARRDAAVRDAVLISVASNVIGAFWGMRAAPDAIAAPRLVQGAALLTLADGWLRTRGGERPEASLVRIADPKPERWGARDGAAVLRLLHSTREGLTSAAVLERRRALPAALSARSLSSAVLEELQTPVVSMLVVAAGFSLVTGAPGDALILGATIALNVAFGVWQTRHASDVVTTLDRMGAGTARVLRDGRPTMVSTTDLVSGDILLLAAGDRVGADARVLTAENLEVDEASLTGESLPVWKYDANGTDAEHVVLDGTGIASGTGTAVVFAVGRATRLGGTAAAIALAEQKDNPLNNRLGELLRQVLPAAIAGGVLVTISGLLRGKPLVPQLAIGTSIMISAVPEGLPLLANLGQAAVARRLAKRGAVVRRLGAVEALGRVDIACLDKTGTLTEGRLAVRMIADENATTYPVGPLPPGPRRVLLTAALASPHPDGWSATTDATDVAVSQAADAAGLSTRARAPRVRELHFEAGHAFHAAVVSGLLRIKGAPESIIHRCRFVRRSGRVRPLDDAAREGWLTAAESLAGQGLRILMVAESTSAFEATTGDLEDPQDLVALGFIGIADPLRPSVPAAVRRCREAGVRVVMLTGDHPATARSIATEAGILAGGEVLTGADLADLREDELSVRLEHATVIARVTPLDKLRIVQCFQQRGHVVAMTGDGVNDAPALRLANVGIAMGEGGTEVARQAADLVLLRNDVEVLVDAFVEGRNFWGNLRRSIGLLLGGNLGEIGAVVGASALGSASPLTVRQVLVVNMITDALPAIAIAMQPPQHHDLAGLAREGRAAFDAPLRRDVVRRAVATAVPTLASYLIALGSGDLRAAQTVAFATVVGTQLVQTVQAGGEGRRLTPAVSGAVGASALVLLATITLRPLRNVLGLVVPSPFQWALIGGGAVLSPILNRVLATSGAESPPAAVVVPPTHR